MTDGRKRRYVRYIAKEKRKRLRGVKIATLQGGRLVGGVSEWTKHTYTSGSEGGGGAECGIV